MSVVAIERIVDGALASADTTTLQITNANGTIIVPTFTVIPTSAGVYSYTTSYLLPGIYTATWTFIVSGYANDIVYRVFVVDSPLQSFEGITLMALEKRVAQACGSYKRIVAGTANTSTSIYSKNIKSTLNLGSFESEYVLRRGIYASGALVANFVEDDRIRGVATYTAATGILNVDREYALQAQENEAIELHYLHPEEELRTSVVEGLERCFFWDTITLSLTAPIGEIDLTGAAPWILDAKQVKRVQSSLLGSRLPPNRIQWTEPYRRGSKIFLRSLGLYTGSIQVTALRPYKSLVNGEMSYVGPNDDYDILHVDPAYATWAGVLKVWEKFPERLAPVAAQGMRLTRKEAADEFTKRSSIVVDQIPEIINHRFGYPLDLGQIGNLTEPAV